VQPAPLEAPAPLVAPLVALVEEPAWMLQIDISARRRRGWFWRLVGSIVARRRGR
jgi:hypothetical protein